ncbi:hypothetical protein J2T14_000146 [Paenibacillus harenae]|nr:hypothetical protein [Paenibacillus harenae]
MEANFGKFPGEAHEATESQFIRHLVPTADSPIFDNINAIYY